MKSFLTLIGFLFLFLSANGQGNTKQGAPKNIVTDLGGYSMQAYLQLPGTLVNLPYFDSCRKIAVRHDSLFQYNCTMFQWVYLAPAASMIDTGSIAGSVNKIPVFTAPHALHNSNLYDSTGIGHSGTSDTFTVAGMMYVKVTPAAVLADSIFVKGANTGRMRVAPGPTGVGRLSVLWPANIFSITPTGTPGTYGSATVIPVITIDVIGCISSVSLVTVDAYTHVGADSTFLKTSDTATRGNKITYTQWDLATGGHATVALSNVFPTPATGTVTNIASGFGILGGPITTTGTLYVDSTKLIIWNDTLSARRIVATVAYIRSLGYGTGSVTTVSTNSTLTGGPITITGTLGINLSNSNTWLAATTTYSATGTGGAAAIDNIMVINQTLNQTSTAAACPLVINRVNTALGTGNQDFLEFQTAGSIKSCFNSTGALLFDRVFATAAQTQGIYASSNGGSTNSTGAGNGNGLFLGQFGSTNSMPSSVAAVSIGINGNLQSNNNATAGQALMAIVGGFVASNAGANTFTVLKYTGTINQSGGATGAQFGINMTPTITASLGGWTSYATNVNSPSLAFVGSGTGKSQFGGNLVLASNTTLDYLITGGAATSGTATLVAGTKTVNTTAIAASDIIILTLNTPGVSVSQYSAPAASIVAGTSFVINAITPGGVAVNIVDVSSVNWLIIHTH